MKLPIKGAILAPFICQHILFNTSHGDKVRNEVRLHFSKGSDGVTSKIGATSVAPKKESMNDELQTSVHR